MINWINLFLYLLVFFALIGLQIFLSLRTAKWPGLILPIFSFIWPLVRFILNFAENYQCIFSVILNDFLHFIFGCIPAAIFYLVYLFCRRKHKKLDEMKKNEHSGSIKALFRKNLKSPKGFFLLCINIWRHKDCA